jgi:hypothetical protein
MNRPCPSFVLKSLLPSDPDLHHHPIYQLYHFLRSSIIIQMVICHKISFLFYSPRPSPIPWSKTTTFQYHEPKNCGSAQLTRRHGPKHRFKFQDLTAMDQKNDHQDIRAFVKYNPRVYATLSRWTCVYDFFYFLSAWTEICYQRGLPSRTTPVP